MNLTNTPANTPREDQTSERKSLRVVAGGSADFSELAKDCVCFANGAGGRIFLGIEDGDLLPPPGQRIDPGLTDRVRRRIGELTVNVQVLPEVQRCDNGGEVLVLAIPRAAGVASTSDGRYYLRVGDTCQPVVGDDVLRLATERPSIPWETLTHLGVPVGNADVAKATRWCAAIRASDRVKASVREKSDSELLEHYGLAVGGVLTNLGVLLIGKAGDRARLGSAPVVQAIRLDAQGKKVGKLSWDDHTLSPIELLDAIWTGVPDFRESYEIPDGMFRATIPAFEESVVRELLVNALVHRPYTQRGDIYLNLDPDKLEVVNPGRLPLGVTPKNILHASRRRNDGLLPSLAGDVFVVCPRRGLGARQTAVPPQHPGLRHTPGCAAEPGGLGEYAVGQCVAEDRRFPFRPRGDARTDVRRWVHGHGDRTVEQHRLP